jgi:hypothetical protein
LTDPECHEHRRSVDDYVTRALKGESSSSGQPSCSSYASDDESSSAESEDECDDDNGYNSEDAASSSFDRINKWTTADGYNLTTFDQTERGNWPICQPLPLSLWAQKSKTPLIFDKVRISNIHTIPFFFLFLQK